MSNPANKMPAETLAALKASIKHWTQNAAGMARHASVSPFDCALCRRFFRGSGDEDECNGCPVKTKTGMSCCVDTPYGAAQRAFHSMAQTGWQQAAAAERDFLISLLPEGETP